MQSSTLTSTIPASEGSFYDQIYSIVKTDLPSAKKKEMLLELKAMTFNNTLDQYDDNGLLTVAGKLASEGDIDSVKILLALGANPSDAAFGAAYGKQPAYAEALRTSYRINIHKLAEGAARGGGFIYAEFLRLKHRASIFAITLGAAKFIPRTPTELITKRVYLICLITLKPRYVHEVAREVTIAGDKAFGQYLFENHGARVNCLVYGAAKLGDQQFAETLCMNSGGSIQESAKGAISGKHVSNRFEALSLLSGLHSDQYRIVLAAELKFFEVKLGFDAQTLVPRARRLHLLYPEKYTLNESIAFLEHPEIQTWFLQAPSALKVLRIDMVLLSYIATFLAPLTKTEAVCLYTRTQLSVAKVRTAFFAKTAESLLTLTHEEKNNKRKVSPNASATSPALEKEPRLTPQKRSFSS